MNRPCFYYLLVLSVLIISMLLPTTAVLGNSDKPAETIALVQQTYDQLQSLSFSFSQSSQGPFSTQDRLGRGQAIFLRSAEASGQARMRWDYEEPDHQVLISDGETLRMYFARLQQQIITPTTALEQDLTYSFFSGRTRLDESFEILAADQALPADGQNLSNLATIRLLPKKEQSQIREIQLIIGADFLIRGIEIVDHFDTRTILTLSDIQPNSLKNLAPAERDQLFFFNPPPDTEIIRQ